MNHAALARVLLALLVANVAATVLHYTDNVFRFHDYPEPLWLNPHLIDSFWFLMTPFAVVGYLCFRRRRHSAAYVCLYIYAVMSLLVLGHYLIAPPWRVSLKINLFILLEAAVAATLAGFTGWLQAAHARQKEGSRRESGKREERGR